MLDREEPPRWHTRCISEAMFNPRSPKEMFIQVLDDAALETVVGGSEFNTDGVSAPEFGSGSTTPYTPGSGGGSSGGGGDGGSYGSGGDGGGGDGGGGDGGGGGGSSGGDSG